MFDHGRFGVDDVEAEILPHRQVYTGADGGHLFGDQLAHLDLRQREFRHEAKPIPIVERHVDAMLVVLAQTVIQRVDPRLIHLDRHEDIWHPRLGQCDQLAIVAVGHFDIGGQQAEMAVRRAAQLGRGRQGLFAPQRGELGDVKRVKRGDPQHQRDPGHARGCRHPLRQGEPDCQQQCQAEELFPRKGQPADRPEGQFAQRQQAAQYQQPRQSPDHQVQCRFQIHPPARRAFCTKQNRAPEYPTPCHSNTSLRRKFLSPHRP